MFTVAEIAEAIGAETRGDAGLRVRRPCEPSLAKADDLALAMDKKYGEALAASAARAAVLWDGADWEAMGLEAAIYVPRPRYAMSGLTGLFEQPRPLAPGIHPGAVIGTGCHIAEDAAIGPFVVVGDGVTIGAGARLFSHVSIADGAQIGAGFTAYEGARIGPGVRIGAHVMIHQNAVVGADGFSFVTPEPGAIDAVRAGEDNTVETGDQEYARIASLGAVIIGDEVEVGAGSTIDRGTVRDTVIGRGTKIDNLVQVGHNVSVGRACLLCGQVGIAGSVMLGDRVVLGGQAGVADNVTIGSDVIVAGAAGVSSNVPPNRVMMGNPAIPMAANVESYKVYRRLPRLAKKVAELQKLVSKASPKE